MSCGNGQLQFLLLFFLLLTILFPGYVYFRSRALEKATQDCEGRIEAEVLRRIPEAIAQQERNKREQAAIEDARRRKQLEVELKLQLAIERKKFRNYSADLQNALYQLQHPTNW